MPMPADDLATKDSVSKAANPMRLADILSLWWQLLGVVLLGSLNRVHSSAAGPIAGGSEHTCALTGYSTSPLWAQGCLGRIPNVFTFGLRSPRITPVDIVVSRCVVETCIGILFLSGFWNTRPPKIAPRQPRSLPRWLPTASKSLSKKRPMLDRFFNKKRTPKSLQKWFKKCLKTGPTK